MENTGKQGKEKKAEPRPSPNMHLRIDARGPVGYVTGICGCGSTANQKFILS